MLMSQPRKRATIKMLCPAGKLVPRPAVTFGIVPPKWQRFYNWPRDKKKQPLPDKVGFPRAEDIPEVVVEVPADQHHMRTLIANGPCSLVDVAPVVVPTPTPAPAKPKKDKG